MHCHLSTPDAREARKLIQDKVDEAPSSLDIPKLHHSTPSGLRTKPDGAETC